MATIEGHIITVSYNEQAIHGMSMTLRQLMQGWDRYRQSVAAQLGMGVTEVVALGHLHQDGPLTPRELGARLALTSGSVTALLDRLVRGGFVTRTLNPDDRRSLLAAVTPAGKHAMQWFFDELDTIVATAFDRFPNLPMAELITALDAAGAELINHARRT
jgi:DNA-binding MarR family transcriptional regulator